MRRFCLVGKWNQGIENKVPSKKIKKKKTTPLSNTGVEKNNGACVIRHSSHDIATQPSHSVDRAGWQSKMVSIEFRIAWCNAHRPHSTEVNHGNIVTLLLLLFASTNFCDFGSGMILRVLIFAISWSRAKFCDFAQPKVKSSTLKSVGFSKCGSVWTKAAAM